MRFDWYQPTVRENPIVIVDELLGSIAPDGEVVEGKGRHNYHQSFTVNDREGQRVAVVLCGGPNGDPNVTASGPVCDSFVPFVRERWPVHRVTRADVAEDFAGEGVYEHLEGVCRAVAAAHNVKGRAIVPDQLEDGRTYYMGAPTSDVRVRLYDKTAEVRRHLAPAQAALVPDHRVRLEAQVRPRKEWKEAASQLEPRTFWGFAGWTRELAAKALALEVERITMQAGRETDYDRALRFLITQYGPTLQRMHAEHGDWAAVGLQLGYLVEQRRRARV